MQHGNSVATVKGGCSCRLSRTPFLTHILETVIISFNLLYDKPSHFVQGGGEGGNGAQVARWEKKKQKRITNEVVMDWGL